MKNDSQLIKSFYKQLDEELENFGLSANKLIETLNFVEYEYIDGKIVGIAGLREGSDFFIIVKKDYQGTGLGQKLLKKVIGRAKNSSCNYIELSVVKQNKSAVHIYKKYAFRIIGSMLAGEKDSYYMIKPLSLRGKLFMLRQKIVFLILAVINTLLKPLR